MIAPYVYSDFLAWLWALSEQVGTHQLRGRGEDSYVDILVDGQISFREPNDPKEKSAYKGKISSDARKSFAIGRVIEAMTVIFRVEDDREYEVRFGTGNLSSFKVKLPMESVESVESGVHENLLLLGDVERILERLFHEFLELRVNEPETILAQFRQLCVPPEEAT